MVLKRCDRCGEFYQTEGELCKSCINKELYDQAKVKDYISSADEIISLGDITCSTGVSIDALERMKSDEDLEDIFAKL